MVGARRRARALALQALFEIDSVGLKHLVPGSVVRVYPDISFSKISRAQARE